MFNLEELAAVLVILFALQDLARAGKIIVSNYEKYIEGFKEGLYFLFFKMFAELSVDMIVIYICVRFIRLI